MSTYCPLTYTATCGADVLDAGEDLLALVELVCRTRERGDHVVIWHQPPGGPCTVAALIRDGADGLAAVLYPTGRLTSHGPGPREGRAAPKPGCSRRAVRSVGTNPAARP